MANQTYLDNVDKDLVKKLLEQTTANAAYFTEIVDTTVRAYSKDLDELMGCLSKSLAQENAVSTDGLERYYAELTNMLYFMAEKVEKLSVYSDMSKAARQEIYNKALLESASQKDEKGKSLRTVAENTSLAESAAQYESVINAVYEHAYKVVRMKVDAGFEMVTTLKNILKRRVSDSYLDSMAANMKSVFDDDDKRGTN